jgi:hypothetical protein
MDYRKWVLLKQDEPQTMFKIAGYSGFIAAGPSPHYDFFVLLFQTIPSVTIKNTIKNYMFIFKLQI